MNEFNEYLEKLREEVKEKPKTDKEAGFQLAVILIYNKYKRSYKI